MIDMILKLKLIKNEFLKNIIYRHLMIFDIYSIDFK